MMRALFFAFDFEHLEVFGSGQQGMNGTMTVT
jgi:hypothetical protein